MKGLRNEKKAALYVKMFGGFAVSYQGSSLLQCTGETQFSSLMQIVLHYREKGVSRKTLEEVLFGDRDITDVHHALWSVIYNAKKKLEQAGLPKANYITIEQGTVCWTKEIPVKEDAREFDRLYQAAQKTQDQEEKLQLLLDACYQYGGEFLSVYGGTLWIAAEARRYHSQFQNCVEAAAELLREKQYFVQMEQLGRYAAKTAPFSDWETLMLEALSGMGKYEEAANLYADTVDRYLREQELRPSQKLLDCLDRLGEQLKHPYRKLDSIQGELEKKRKDSGAYLCSYPVFREIYQIVMYLAKRSGKSSALMLCTIVDSKGNPMKEGTRLEKLSGRLKEAICSSVRQSDVVNQYGKGQYLILLLNSTKEECTAVQKRIDDRFLVGRQRTGIQYCVNSVRSE